MFMCSVPFIERGLIYGTTTVLNIMNVVIKWMTASSIYGSSSRGSQTGHGYKNRKCWINPAGLAACVERGRVNISDLNDPSTESWVQYVLEGTAAAII